MYFFIVPAASVILFVVLWREDLVPQPYVIGALVAGSIALEFLSPPWSVAYFVGALLNVGLALYLAILLKLKM